MPCCCKEKPLIFPLFCIFDNNLVISPCCCGNAPDFDLIEEDNQWCCIGPVFCIKDILISPLVCRHKGKWIISPCGCRNYTRGYEQWCCIIGPGYCTKNVVVSPCFISNIPSHRKRINPTNNGEYCLSCISCCCAHNNRLCAIHPLGFSNISLMSDTTDYVDDCAMAGPLVCRVCEGGQEAQLGEIGDKLLDKWIKDKKIRTGPKRYLVSTFGLYKLDSGPAYQQMSNEQCHQMARTEKIRESIYDSGGETGLVDLIQCYS